MITSKTMYSSKTMYYYNTEIVLLHYCVIIVYYYTIENTGYEVKITWLLEYKYTQYVG